METTHILSRCAANDLFRIRQIASGTLATLKLTLEKTPSDKSFLIVFLASSLLGLATGFFHQQWQVAVESAQVFAGIVSYPHDNPNYIYQINTWTILHQILAGLLKLGVSEMALSLILSGLSGMIAFQALSLTVFAISEDKYLSVLFPCLMLHTFGNVLPGITYPVMILGYTHTYGIVGLSFIALVIAMFSNGKYKAGSFLLGISAAIHPSMGIWLNLVVGVVFLWNFRKLYPHLKESWRFLAAGYGITVMSFLFHLASEQNVSIHTDEAMMNEFLVAFLLFWDNHRHTFDLVIKPVQLVFLSVLISFILLLNLKNRIRAEALFIGRALIAAAVIAAAGSAVYWFPPESTSFLLWSFMPSRLFNLNTFLLMPVIVGVLGRYRNCIWSELALIVVILLMVLRLPKPLIPFLPFFATLMAAGAMLQYGIEAKKQIAIGIGLVFVCFLAFIKTAMPMFYGHHHSPNRLLLIALVLSIGCGFLSVRLKEKWHSRFTRGSLRGITVCLLVFGCAIFFAASMESWRKVRLRTDPVIEAMKQGRGMTVTASNLGMIQLRSRRPVLLDGHGLDGLIYAPEAAPTLDTILKKIYGVDFLHPTEDIKYARPGALLPGTGRKLWEERTKEEWQSIGKEFSVTAVLTYPNWKLNLPVIASSEFLMLYEIPQIQ